MVESNATLHSPSRKLRVFVAVPELGLPLPFALRMWCGAPNRELDIMRSEALELVLDSGRSSTV